MDNIAFYKYASHGNNFVIIDETKFTAIPESQKSIFANLIGTMTTGVGCDSVIYIQKYLGPTNQIQARLAAQACLSINVAPIFSMRIYENGLETNMCGNGLICLTHHLQNQYNIMQATIATEIPTGHPVLRKVKWIKNNLFQAILGAPILPPTYFFNPIGANANSINSYYVLNEIALNIENKKIIFNKCYLTFTGEPHLVIFKPTPNENSELHNIFNILFSNTNAPQTLTRSIDLINHIGKQFNDLKIYFPNGINVNVVEVVDKNKIYYRCYERGIDAETHACGTGATAVAAMSHHLKLIISNNVTIIPWRAKHTALYENAQIILTKEFDNYSLTASSLFLAKGEYYYPELTHLKAA